MNKAIGILGGTFDPIHFGHLRMAIDLHFAVNLDHVRLAPCYIPVHRTEPACTASERVEMIKLAIQDEPILQLETCEIDRQGLSYTIDTIFYLKEKFPNHPLCLILGSDALINFTSWQRWNDILANAHLLIAHRPLFTLPTEGKIGEILKTHLTNDIDKLHTQQSGLIYFRDITQLQISATQIRKQVAEGLNPRYLLPDNVLHFIRNNKIYLNK